LFREKTAVACFMRRHKMMEFEKSRLEHLTRRLNRLWIHMRVRIRFNIHTGTKGPVMNGEALF
jgi:hypothetical protein